MMLEHFPSLIIVIPLLSALAICIASWLNKRFCFPITAISLGLSLATSVGMLVAVMAEGTMVYRLAGWAAPMGINYKVDYLNGIVLVVVLLVALMNIVGAKEGINREFAEKKGTFYSLYLLFVAGMIGMVVTGDAFNLYVLLEIASLTGYALIGIGKGRAPLASLNYLFMGTVGATFYLLGVGYLYFATGTLDMADIAKILPDLYGSRTVVFAFILCMTGLFAKMAIFPLHGWLPNAYSYSPSVSTGVVAPLTTKVMVYVMIRMALYVFTPEFTFETLEISGAMVNLGIVSIVMGSLMALAQKRLKKMLTYVIIAEVGYMVGGFWLGNRLGISGAILHIVNDAVMTLCVFMAAGAIVHKARGDHFDNLKGMFRKMPYSMAAFVVGGLSIIGVPPTCGFFSKWYLISGGIAAGAYLFVAALLFSSLINAVLFFRIFEIAHFEPFAAGHHGPAPEKIEDAGPAFLVPLFIVASLLLVLGIYSGDIVTKIIQFAIPAGIV